MDYRRHLPRARAYLAALNIPPDLTGIQTQLSHYPDTETLNFLRPGEDLAEQRALNEAVAHLLRARGATVVFVPLHLSDYFTFLARYDLRDDPANRAQFISWTTAADPKPTPRRS